jgi:hypothetical protein
MVTTINSLGLILDIAGALFLFCFGLPPRIDPEGHQHLILEQVDGAEIALGKRYRFLSKVAIVLLILGFIGQLVSNYLY